MPAPADSDSRRFRCCVFVQACEAGTVIADANWGHAEADILGEETQPQRLARAVPHLD